MIPEIDSINICQNDSSEVVFEMSPEYKKTMSPDKTQGKIEFHNAAGVSVPYPSSQQNNFNESMTIRSVTAVIKDHSILDVGHA